MYPAGELAVLRQLLWFIKYIPCPDGQPRTKGQALFLEVLRCSQIGLFPESIFIQARRIWLNFKDKDKKSFHTGNMLEV